VTPSRSYAGLRTFRARDLFAGPGGWDLAAQALGWSPYGWEIDPWTQLTRSAAQLKTAGNDVRDVDPGEGSWDTEIASPPCQAFSDSGLKAARSVLDVILSAVEMYRRGRPPRYSDLAQACGVEGAALVLEPLRVLLGSDARAAAWEQVPSVLPIWEACAVVLRERGWSVATGILSAEMFGLAQLRNRAILVARRDGVEARLPHPTHSRYYPKDPGRLDLLLEPWRGMDRILDVDPDARVGFPRRMDRPGQSVTLDGVEYRARDVRSVQLPSQTITEKARSWSVWEPGQARRPLDLTEAMRLQTFPVSHPFQGPRSQMFLQIANAIPPRLAWYILRELKAVEA
jgi:DNA (cytosine-5)-methyltransferase 1